VDNSIVGNGKKKRRKKGKHIKCIKGWRNIMRGNRGIKGEHLFSNRKEAGIVHGPSP
jgi:hypothetical protein